MTVAALYVETGGVYYGLDDVDPWDEARDARLYEGPWPVVAHPPCARWSVLAPLVEYVHGYKRGGDGGTFAAALSAVRTFGGVLEHPAQSLAWSAYGLPRPGTGGWTTAIGDDGATTEVAQVAYGHEARKRTWLYAVGCDLPALNWSEPAASSFVSYARGYKEARAAGQTILHHGMSQYTPDAFRDVLLDMARSASPARLDGCT